MWGLRQQVSLLMDHGHPEARYYPLGMAWEEAEIVVNRQNQEAASNTTLLHAAASAVMSKEANRKLRTMLKELTSG